MLKGMQERGLKEKHEEQIQYAAYKQWCESEIDAKSGAVAEATEAADLLAADIGSLQTEADNLAAKIKELQSSVGKWTNDTEVAVYTRSSEKDAYTKLHQDYTESITAVTAAIGVLKDNQKSKKDASSAVSLLSTSRLVPKEAAQQVASFLSLYHSAESQVSGKDPLDEDAKLFDDEKSASVPLSSGGITEMLEKLREKFSDERREAETSEVAHVHAFQLLKQELETSIKTAGSSKDEKVQAKAKALETVATKKADLADTTATKADDQKYLADVSATCTQKAADFVKRQQLRDSESSTISQAIDALSSSSVANSEAKTRSLLQAGTALASLRSRNPAQEKVAVFLANMAKKFESNLLATAAERVMADPLANVRTLIQGLITRLQSENTEEQEHGQWCQSEMETNEKARKSRGTDSARLQTELEATGTKAAKLKSEISELTALIVQNVQSSNEAQKERLSEKSRNEATIKDAQDAQAAITSAVTVLKEFYEGTIQSPSFIQMANGKVFAGQPKIFDGDYEGQGGSSVLVLLEVVQSDYAKLETTTKANEAEAVADFERQSTEAQVLQDQQKKDVEHKTREQSEAEQLEVTLKADLESAQKELAAAEEYYEKLKDSCMASGSNAKERAARREAEIQSLKDALAAFDESRSTSA